MNDLKYTRASYKNAIEKVDEGRIRLDEMFDFLEQLQEEFAHCRRQDKYMIPSFVSTSKNKLIAALWMICSE